MVHSGVLHRCLILTTVEQARGGSEHHASIVGYNPADIYLPVAGTEIPQSLQHVC